MSPEITRRKLTLLIKNLDLLKKYKDADVATINKNHLAIERLLHLVIEIMGDINHHMIVLKEGRPPKSLKDSFIEMGNLEILDQKLAHDLAPSAGLRNALIHMYDDINIDFVKSGIAKILQLVPNYIKEVEKKL